MKIKDLKFDKWYKTEEDILLGVKLDNGSKITILDRQTGFYHGLRDTETGFRSSRGDFWLASGMFDIREFPDLSIDEGIRKIKDNSNTVVPEPTGECPYCGECCYNYSLFCSKECDAESPSTPYILK